MIAKVVGGALLIAGTTVGAGMLALPLATGLLGFLPTMVVFALIWGLMLWSAFLIIEVNQAIPGQVNLISMAKATLGSRGAAGMWVVFLLLFYALLSAYFTGSGTFLAEVVESIWGVTLPFYLKPLFLLTLLGPFIWFGMRSVDMANRYLMMGKILAYLVLVSYVIVHITPQLLLHVDFRYTVGSFAVVLTAFGYHVLIPSLMEYLNRDVSKVRLCVLTGSLLSLISYVVWEVAILGTIPATGSSSIQQLVLQGHSVAQALQSQLAIPRITYLARIFALFAMGTSFLGVSMGLFDFLRDGMKLSLGPQDKLKSLAFTYVPPFLFAVIWPSGFILALEYAGVLAAILLGVFPVLMAVKIRGKWQLSTGVGLCVFVVLIAVALGHKFS